MRRIWLIPVALIVMSMLWTGVAVAGGASEGAAAETAGYHDKASGHDGEACEFKYLLPEA